MKVCVCSVAGVPGGVDAGDATDAAMWRVLAAMEDEPFGVVVERLQRYRDWLNAFEAKQVAARRRAGHSDRATRAVLRRSGKVSKQEAKKRARRADAVATNNDLAAGLVSGVLSTEHVDAVADASARTGGDAATDRRLIDSIKTVTADQARQLADDYVDDHNSRDAQSEHDRQRRLRNASRTITPRGTGLIRLEGDRPTINAIWARLRADADRLYRLDGDRDLPAGQHPRTGPQRLFDAATHLLTPTTGSAGGSAGAGGGGPVRSTLVATTTVEGLAAATGADPATLTGELIGTGTIPRPVLEYLACTSPLVAMIFDQTGEVLWQGRNVRHATPAQMVALTVRDHGCVLCNADPQLCDAHHLIPWAAPARGPTDIDNLALVCRDCHTHIHTTNQTLYHDRRTQVWKLRTATPNETPPPQPEHSRRASNRQAASRRLTAATPSATPAESGRRTRG